LKVNDENSRIRIQDPDPELDPDPLGRSMDLRIRMRIRIHPKISWIRNTGYQPFFYEKHLCPHSGSSPKSQTPHIFFLAVLVFCLVVRVADPHSFHPDPDPAFQAEYIRFQGFNNQQFKKKLELK
jgi:hypothetical protein